MFHKNTMMYFLKIVYFLLFFLFLIDHLSIENEIVTSFAYNEENKTWAVATTSHLNKISTKIKFLLHY